MKWPCGHIAVASSDRPQVRDALSQLLHVSMQAQRLRFKHMDMQHLEEQLVAAKDSRLKLVVTDGVFSMDGDVAPLDHIIDLAHSHGAQVVVDECHATGVLGASGRGTDEHHGVLGKVLPLHVCITTQPIGYPFLLQRMALRQAAVMPSGPPLAISFPNYSSRSFSCSSLLHHSCPASVLTVAH